MSAGDWRAILDADARAWDDRAQRELLDRVGELARQAAAATAEILERVAWESLSDEALAVLVAAGLEEQERRARLARGAWRVTEYPAQPIPTMTGVTVPEGCRCDYELTSSSASRVPTALCVGVDHSEIDRAIAAVLRP